MWNFLYLGVCLLFSLLLVFFIKTKARIKTKENALFEASIYVCISSIVTEIILQTMASYKLDNVISTIFNKLYLVLIVLWFVVFSKYVFYIFKPEEKSENFEQKNEKFTKKYNIISKIHNIVGVLFSVIICILPIEHYLEGTKMYSYGAAVDFLKISLGVFIISWLIVSVKNIKRIANIKYLPILVVFILLIANIVIQNYEPTILIVSFTFTFLSYILYHTIENPDIQMLREMETAKLQAEKANRAKSDFLSSMSHEIRTPLNAIVGLTEDNMTHNELPDDVKENNTDIFNASQTLLEIVGNILDINRIEAEKVEVNPNPYNIREEVEKICKMQSSRIGEKPIQFYHSIAEDVPVELIGDRVLVKQILNNLLSNAIKYTDEGTVKIDIHSINRGDDATLMINVSDTGRGIKKEYIDKLFSKFERLDIEKNTTTQGTGLGLAITKSLVEMMGGKINVQSEFGRGTLFVVTLPQKIGKQDVDLSNTQVLKLYNTNKMKAVTPNVEQSVKTDNVEENETLAEELMPTLKNVAPTEILEDNQEESHSIDTKKVLIVDDNKLNIKVARKAMSDLNYEIDEVYNGNECLEKIKEKQYDVILMDIMMPGMSGDETLAKLKEDSNFRIPVIAVTADVESGSEAKYLSQGFTSYIGKPFTRDQIKEELDKLFINDKKETTISNNAPLKYDPNEDRFKDAPTFVYGNTSENEDNE